MTLWVQRLLYANIAVFLLQMSMPGTVTRLLALVPAALLVRPWTIITYMFAHSTAGLTHILFNMFALYIFGPRVEARLGSAHFIRMYLIAGITGGLLSLVFTPSVAIVGASGAVFGVQLAFAMFYPRDKILIWGIIPVEARVLVILMTLITLWGGFKGGGGVAHFAHLGGYIGAFLYLKWAEKRSPAKQWQAKVAGPPPKAIPLGDWRSVNLSMVHEVNRDEVQRILQKIADKGEGSLTAQERVFLGHFVPKQA
jgi:membrane associated rhomboid family serine protease